MRNSAVPRLLHTDSVKTKRNWIVKAFAEKTKNAWGFTLSEVLVAVLILVMITATALPAALNAYKNAVDAANAQVLLSTAVNALRAELSTAWDVENIKDNKTITFKSADTGSKSQITVGKLEGDTQERIILQEYYSGDDLGWLDGVTLKSVNARPLVSRAMTRTTRDSSEHMTVIYSTAELLTDTQDNQYVAISGLCVKRGDATLAKMPDSSDNAGLIIRVMTNKGNSAAGGGNG